MKILITELLYDILVEQFTELKKLKYITFKNQDHNTFIRILKGIKSPITYETLGFMYAWRECETSLGGASNKFCNNPFNTSWDVDQKGIQFCSTNSKMYCTTNNHGVKSYKTIDIGVDATIKTLLSGKYNNLLNSLRLSEKNKWNCLDIAKNLKGDLDRWGTQDRNIISKCTSYLKGAIPKPAIIIQKSGCK